MRHHIELPLSLMLGCLVIIMAVLTGWIANIVQVCMHLHDPITGLFIAKIAGAFVAPLGAILGFIGMF